ncbi:MAG TPA: hypothetical protein VLK89_00230 [Solirubrobacterales bacterium]|nr:hypothetical protein [Solirubrobacterales bacterium]
MQSQLRKTFFTGTAVSIIAGAVLTAVGMVSSTKWEISALFGLVALLTGILITALYAFAQRLDQIDENRIAVQPLQHLYKVPHIELPVVRIVDAVASTHNKRSSFLTKRTTNAVEQFSQVIADMADGTFVCSSQEEELDLVKGALAETRREVRAVASRGVEWWLKPEADVYFQAYGEATRRIAITRIFLIDKGDLERVLPVLSRHGAAGIRTYALDQEQVPEGRRRGLVLFDNTLLHRAAARREGVSNFKDVEFTDVANEIRRAEDDFEFLLKLATTRDLNPPATLFAVEPNAKGF